MANQYPRYPTLIPPASNPPAWLNWASEASQNHPANQWRAALSVVPLHSVVPLQDVLRSLVIPSSPGPKLNLAAYHQLKEAQAHDLQEFFWGMCQSTIQLLRVSDSIPPEQLEDEVQAICQRAVDISQAIAEKRRSPVAGPQVATPYYPYPHAVGPQVAAASYYPYSHYPPRAHPEPKNVGFRQDMNNHPPQSVVTGGVSRANVDRLRTGSNEKTRYAGTQ
ncbi:hypothetical protein HGRIS_000348 [Hohenbuehelia grisea]|uniref:Gag protein n=1 Tax=Hohenbuehelia grisea TaxID=104357 RepID=A0ABR3JRZ1_9AGAR